MKPALSPFIGLIALFCVLVSIQPGAQIDRVWSDVILKSHNVQVPSEYLIVNVSAEDQKQYGGLPLSRAVIADVLTALEDGGAERVLLDMILLEQLTTEHDAKLVSSMEKLDAARLAIAHSSQNPDQKFQQFSTLIDMRLQTDKDGWTRHVGSSANDRGYNPSIWLANGQALRDRVKLDQRYDPDTVERMSIAELMNTPADRFNGRRVIFSQNPVVSSSRIRIPLMQSSDRALATILAAASITNNHVQNVRVSKWIGLGLTFLCIVLGYRIGLLTHQWVRLALCAMAMVFILIWTNLQLMTVLGGHSHPILQFSGFLLGTLAALIHRLKLIPTVGGFMKGDLSPEEAWAWRSLHESRHPVILLSGLGQVRRLNPAARSISPYFGPEFGQECLRQYANGSDEIDLSRDGRNTRIFAMSWPNPTIPIVILKDISEDRQRYAALQKQVYTDPLTGLANRAGFDQALNNVGVGTQCETYDIMFMDMNGFKAVNDTHGHDAGDQLLRVIAKRLQDLSTRNIVIARLGGDEFAILHRGTRSDGEVAQMSSRIEKAIKQPVNLAGISVVVGVAIGCAKPKSLSEPVQMVLNRADQAMYAQKNEIKRQAA